MEEQSSEVKLGGVTFMSRHNSLSYPSMNWKGDQKYQTSYTRSKGDFCTYNNNNDEESGESRDSLTGAMEHLCRPWSPSASHFLLHSFPSQVEEEKKFTKNNGRWKTSTHTNDIEMENISTHASIYFLTSNANQNLLPLNVNDRRDDYEEELEEDEELRKRGIAYKGNNIRMDLNHTKGWLKLGKSLPSFLKSRRDKKKEETRFYAAKLHAALSITQLAAAIASFATSGGSQVQDTTTKAMAIYAQEQADVGVAFTSAAALMTAIWAESAESLGAPKAQVASAINSGLAIRSPIDIIAVTAKAATSLRGAATLKSRFMEQASYFQRSQEMLKAGAQICIIMASGHREYKWVAIYFKHKEPILSFRKKYLGGALTTSKKYKVINIIEETKKEGQGEGYLFIRLKTNKGIMKLLFEDEKQSTIWISTISTLLNPPNYIN